MESEKLTAASQSIKVNVILAVVKLATGIYTGSLGVIAEFLHSFFDLLASFFAYFGIKKAMQPPDSAHPYGHHRVENVSSLLQAGLITVTSLLIVYGGYDKVMTGVFGVRESWIGIVVMVGTIIVDVWISRYLHKKSDKTGSPALKADAYHFSTDMWSTAAVILGLVATQFGFPIGDVIAAVFVAIIMMKLSFHLGSKAARVMLDQSPDQVLLEKITMTVAGYPGLKGYHSLRAREAGSHVFVDVSVHLDRKMSLEDAHRIAEQLERKVKEDCPTVTEVVVHVEPESLHDVESMAESAVAEGAVPQKETQKEPSQERPKAARRVKRKAPEKKRRKRRTAK
jgi:cation diffusion facilitator family transporter